ncbi:MAG: ABC transporter ATP-binding protein [Chloroflexota bacterium]|nr:ABC transporter ATP-binding protein [Chloroflexota bacterium]
MDFEVRDREVVGIIGPTGCGKTTLLGLIAGFDSPTTGELEMSGKPITGPGPDRGFIFQQANVFPWLTLRENVLFAAKSGRHLNTTWSSPAGLEALADRYLESVGLTNAAKLYPYEASGGMRSRAALARVLLANPDVLLMDEPFAALDAQTRSLMHQLLLRLFRVETERTVVLITHDVEEALILCDRIYVMSSSPGTMIANVEVPFGHPREYQQTARRPEFVEMKFDIQSRLEPFLRTSGQ